MKIIHGPRYGGYAENHLLIEDAAFAADGEYIMQYVDTAEMLTPEWDRMYLEAIGDKKIFVVTSNVTDDLTGRALYRFSFPLISRELYQKCGMFCLGRNPSVDRCWEAFATEMNCEIKAPVNIIHREKRNTDHEDRTAKESQPFYKQLNDHWESRSAEHKAIGKQFADLVRGKNENPCLFDHAQ
jgi:hypothetical protein